MARTKGAKDYKPNDTDRDLAVKMSRVGIRQEQIALVVGISKETLVKFYHAEMERARVEATVTVANNLFAMTKKVPAAAMFWLKCQGGWRENEIPTTAGNQNFVFQFSDIDPKSKDEVLIEH